MENLDTYYKQLADTSGTTSDDISWITTSGNGYTYFTCGQWVADGEGQNCYSPVISYYPYYTPENKTEKAFKVLKCLVKESIITEPKSFKKFCDLIEKIARVI